MQQRRLVITILVVVLILYLIFPFRTDVQILNSLNEPQTAHVTVSAFGIPLVSTTAHTFSMYFPKLPFTISIEQYGFHTIERPHWFRLNVRPGVDFLTYTLEEKELALDTWEFKDATGTLRLDPFLKITGQDVRGKKIDDRFRYDDRIPWGWYSVHVQDVNFEGLYDIEGNTLQQNGMNVTTPLVLVPNEKFYSIDSYDFNFIKNFITEYLELSADGLIEEQLSGFPHQYFLARHNRTVSFGDMLFLLCEAQTYGESQETYYLPKNKRYAIATDAFSPEYCYQHTLQGYVPVTVGRESLSALLQSPENYYPWDSMLSQNVRRANMALTFDAESGRYVFRDNKGPNAINPCRDEITSIGIPEEDRHLCEDANMIGWFSPVMGEPENDIPYPWSSGVEGLRVIRDLSKSTGIPTSLYLVTRELEVYDYYDRTLNEDFGFLSQLEVIELGFHSKYHAHLGTANHEHTAKELAEEKLILEERFDTEIIGHRAPYLSILEANQLLHEQTLIEQGFTYYTHGLSTKGIILTNKPYTLHYMADRNLEDLEESADTYGYVLTLDHPWNVHYVEEEHGEDVYLVYDAARPDQFKATIFEAISAGFIPVTARDIRIPE